MVMPLDRLANLTTVSEGYRDRGRWIPGVATTRQVWCRLQRTNLAIDNVGDGSTLWVEGKQKVLIRFDASLLTGSPYSDWTMEIDGVALNITAIYENLTYQRMRYMTIEVEGVV